MTDSFIAFLTPRSYAPVPITTPGLWNHDNSKNLMFTLVVDDFGVKFTKTADGPKT
jgi:hypothetical protein